MHTSAPFARNWKVLPIWTLLPVVSTAVMLGVLLFAPASTML